MNDKSSQIAAVAAFSQRYRKEYLDDTTDDEENSGDPFNLRFLLKRAFASARSESVSAGYRKSTETVLSERESSIRNRWSSSEEGISNEELEQALSDEGVGNKHDRKMVVELVGVLGRIDGHDIIDHSEREIKRGATDDVYDLLIGIHNIGPKKATLYLRDLVMESELDEYIKDEQYRFVVPIDTWVHQVGKEIGIFSTTSPDWDSNSEELVEACGDQISPLEFNQGAWYLGANAFDVVVDNLDQLNPEFDG